MSEDTIKAEGIIKIINSAGNFGFITLANTDYFFHSSMVMDGSFHSLKSGDRVIFEPQPSQRIRGKMEAHNVELANTTEVTIPVKPPRPIVQKVMKAPEQKKHENSSNTPLLPYGFVPIDVTFAITDTPVWHDGSFNTDITENIGLLSGELRCTLTALTPLLPGNARYPIHEDGDSKKESVADAALLTKSGFGTLDPGKQIAEPMRLPAPDGRVVIPGSALKGMIRHSLSALLSAPMERVGERHYTYRSNLDFNPKGVNEKFVCRPALVIAKKANSWIVDVFDDARAAIFIRSNAKEIVRSAANTNNEVIEVIRGISLRNNRIELAYDRHSQLTLNHRLALYKGGIDGEGLLAGTAQKQVQTYRHALVPLDKGCTLEITHDLYQRYLHDQNEVLADSDIGHLTAHPHKNLDLKKASAAIKKNSELEINQLIYVEVSMVNGKITHNSHIVSFGHHFRYRWAYSSTVRIRDVRKAGDNVREYLKPKACELVSDDHSNGFNIPPAQLTAARLVFGYVNYGEKHPISKKYNFGTGIFERLAGRIAINHAISQECPDFLGDRKNGYCLPLPILGQPKSSAWEFYLQQDPKQAPATYGDLSDYAGGELAGRKFYRHQPSVQDAADIVATDPEIIKSDQATLARYICKPGTQFKFSIRFCGLRPWELGALLITLQPHRLVQNGAPADFAHKLGMGRPLGMGSVRINIDAVSLRSKGRSTFETGAETDRLSNDATKALATRLFSDAKAKSRLRIWMDIHTYKDLGKLDYPHGTRNGTIFEWHTDLRREYSKLRRQENPKWEAFLEKINDRMKVMSYHPEADFIDPDK